MLAKKKVTVQPPKPTKTVKLKQVQSQASLGRSPVAQKHIRIDCSPPASSKYLSSSKSTAQLK
jgi:hypothetical protein